MNYVEACLPPTLALVGYHSSVDNNDILLVVGFNSNLYCNHG